MFCYSPLSSLASFFFSFFASYSFSLIPGFVFPSFVAILCYRLLFSLRVLCVFHCCSSPLLSSLLCSYLFFFPPCFCCGCFLSLLFPSLRFASLPCLVFVPFLSSFISFVPLVSLLFSSHLGGQSLLIFSYSLHYLLACLLTWLFTYSHIFTYKHSLISRSLRCFLSSLLCSSPYFA